MAGCVRQAMGFVGASEHYLFLGLAHGIPCVLHEVLNLTRALLLVASAVGCAYFQLEAEEGCVGALGHAERARLTLLALALAILVGRTNESVGRGHSGFDQTANVKLVVFDSTAEDGLGVNSICLEGLLDCIAELV